MKILRSIISNYEGEFKNDVADTIVSNLTTNQLQAWTIIKDHAHLPDDALNRKLASDIYGYETDHRTYKSFKSTLTKKINNIVLTHQSEGSQMQRITFELAEDICIISKMFSMGLKEVVRDHIRSATKKAIKYHKTEMARTLATMNISYQYMNGSKEDIRSAKSQLEAIIMMCDEELELEGIYNDLCKKDIIDEDTKVEYRIILEHTNLTDKLIFDSCRYHYFYYSIRLLICDSTEYEKICHQAIEYFTHLHFDHEAYLSIFKNRLLKYRISQSEYIKCKLVINTLLSNHREYSYHWYLYKLTYVKVLLYAQDYQEAYNAYHRVINSRNFREQKKDHKNEWHILGMYVNLMSDNTEDINLRKIKYNLNHSKVDRSSKNKKYLIAELIYLIKTNHTDIEKHVTHLSNLCNGDPRVMALIEFIKTQQKKFDNLPSPSFEEELVQYDHLIMKV